ncbi:hypothetical protein KW791_00065 [Candidatus Parcubacteria bacterium]|nr:hypothetical protein [Candidatus Parcubacteria bacterium]
MTGGISGTAPEIFVGSTDQTAAVITTAGAIATQYGYGIFKVGDILWINYDQDGTPGQNVYTVTATSGGSLVTYTEALGGALLAANNLDDVDSVSTARTNLGLGILDNVRFARIDGGASGSAGSFRSYPSAATSGYLALLGVANAGDYAVTISNASHGQATVYSIPDVGAATGQILVKTAALVDGNFVGASGTAGKVADSGYGVNNVLLYASVAVSAAEFNGAYAAPKLLIAAPGANKMIIVDRMEMVMTFVSAAYANGGVVFAQYDSTANGAGVKATNTEAAADFFAVASAVFAFIGTSNSTVGVLPFTTCANKGLYLSNATGAFTTGDSTWIVKIHYRIIATA